MSRFAVKLVNIGNGERMPFLVEIFTGLGNYEATAFSLTLRSKGLQVNTLVQALRSVQFLFETLSESGISLIERAKDNDLLNLGEIEALVARCKYKKSILKNDTALGSPNVVPIRSALTKTRISRLNLHAVKADTAAMRLHYIASYLQWFVDYIFLLNIPSNRQEFREIGTLTIRAIKDRTPNSSTSKAQRKGLTKEQEHKLLRLIELDSPQNPWSNQFIRNRNNLIVRLLLATGIRKGELLGLKIQDVDFGKNMISISRRPDDIEDFRIRQPQAKTASRRLQIAQDLADSLREHIEEYRIKQGDARKHPFIFVSDQGIPLALNSVDLIFSMLRRAAPELAPIPVRGDGLVQPTCAGLASVEHHGHRFLHRSGRGGDRAPRQARDLQHRPGQPVHQRRVHAAGHVKSNHEMWSDLIDAHDNTPLAIAPSLARR